MCGIYGQFNPHGADPALIERMARRLAHRGPDGAGAYHSGPLAFGAGRLAIIDLAAGVQPIFSEDRRIAVVYNGEIYNYRELRAELEAAGHVFTTQTDTEVIVHGYEQWGDTVLERLRGMFGLCVWDAPNERLLLARDRMGEKPLYYAHVGDEFIFASEIKALFEHPGLRPLVNAAALPAYLTLGYTPPPYTMFAGIEKLAAGEFMVIERGRSEKARYWTATMDTSRPPSYDESVRQVRESVIEAVETRLMSDVPLGAFLSGGLDSTAVVAIMGRLMGRPVQTFTVGFGFEAGSKDDNKFNVDARYSKLAAERLGTEHHAITIPQNNSLAEILPHLIYALDEPVAQPSIVQTAYVAALARMEGVPVMLTGDAGDELFLGYPRYRSDLILERYLRIPALLRSAALTPLLEHLPAHPRFESARKLARKSRNTDSIQRYLEWQRIFGLEQLPGLLSDDRLAASGYASLSPALRPLLDAPNTPHFADRIAYASLNLWIAEESNMRVDKMCMAMSIESRAPLEDHKLVELALTLPLEYKLRGGDFKAVFKDAVADFVPREVLERPKWGFFPPSSGWLRGVLRPLVDKYLSPEYVAAVGYFEPDAVQKLVDTHMNGGYELWTLWSLLTFHIWHALYIDGSLTLDSTLTPQRLMSERAPVRTIEAASFS